MGKQNEIIDAVRTRNVDKLHSLLIGEKELSLNYSSRGAVGAQEVGDAGASVVAAAISKGGLILEKVVFWDAGVTDVGAQAIAEALRCNKHVKHLCFSYNKIGDSGARAFADILEENTTLEVLDLGANPLITHASVNHFIAGLNKNVTLRSLIMGHSDLFSNDPVMAAQLRRNAEKRVSAKEFISAAEQGYLAILELSIKSGIDVNNTINSDGWTALHQAASYNQVAVIELLIKKGHANIEVQNTTVHNIGWRPLHCAAWNGRKEAILALLEFNADPTAKTIQAYPNKTPAELALVRGFLDIPAFIESFRSGSSHSISSVTATLSQSLALLDALLKESIQGKLNKKHDIRTLIMQGAIPWPVNDQARTPLHLAVEHGRLHTMKCLIDFFVLQPPFKSTVLLEPAFREALIDMQDLQGDTALHIAMRKVLQDEKKYLPIIRFLLQSGADIHQENNKKVSPVIIALTSEMAKKIPAIHNLFKKVNAFNKGKKELLEVVNLPLGNDKTDSARKWFKNYSDVTDILGNSYLCWAAQVQNKGVSNFFCDYLPKQILAERIKKFYNMQNEVGDTALHVAAIDGNDYFFKLFFDNPGVGFDQSLLSIKNHKSQTITMICLQYGNRYMLRTLLTAAGRFSIDLDAFKLLKGRNPAHLGALTNNLELIDFFNSSLYKKYFYQVDGSGSLPIHCAAKYGFTDILCYLILHFPDLRDKVDANGNTPLNVAAQRGQLSSVKYLIAVGSKLDSINREGKTVFDIAKKVGNKQLVAFVEAAELYNPIADALRIDVVDEVFQGGGIKGVAYMGSLWGMTSSQCVTSQYFHRNSQRVCGASAGGITALLLALVGADTAQLNKITTELSFDLLLKNEEDDDVAISPAKKNFADRFKRFKNSSLNLDQFGLWSFLFMIIEYAQKILLPKAGMKAAFIVQFILETTELSNRFIPKLSVSLANALRFANWLFSVADLEKELCRVFGLKNSSELQQFVEALIDKLVKNKGIFDGKAIHQWFNKIIEEKTTVNGKVIANITFAELANLAQAHPELDIKDISLVAVNITTGQTQIFSQHHTPDSVVVDVMRATMSIPGFYMPCTIRRKQANGPLVNDGDLYVDGGLFDNYAPWVFERNKAQDVMPNSKLLGFRLVTAEQKRLYESLGMQLMPRPITGVVDYLKNIAAGCLSKQESDHVWNQTEQNYTVYNYHQDHSPIDFDIDNEQKGYLERSGYLGLFGFLARRFIINYELALQVAKKNQTKGSVDSTVTFVTEAAAPVPAKDNASKSEIPVSQNRYTKWYQNPLITVPVTAAATIAAVAVLLNANTLKEKIGMSLK